MEIIWFVAGALAAYRLAYMTTTDTGPARVFLRMRQAIARRYGAGSWQYEGATCVFCQSVWYAALIAGLLEFIHVPAVRWLVTLLALAGAALVLHWLVLTCIKRVEE